MAKGGIAKGGKAKSSVFRLGPLLLSDWHIKRKFEESKLPQQP